MLLTITLERTLVANTNLNVVFTPLILWSEIVNNVGVLEEDSTDEQSLIICSFKELGGEYSDVTSLEGVTEFTT